MLITEVRARVLRVAAAALLLGVGACSTSPPPPSSPAPAPPAPASSSDTSSSGTPTTTTAAEASPTTSDPATAAPFGPGCAALPATTALAGDAVAGDPALTQLTRALTAAGYLQLLGDPSASYTVFAPTDAAFAALPAGRLDALLADPAGELTTLLGSLVSAQRLDAAALVTQGSVSAVGGASVLVTGTAGAPVIDGVPVSCGNVQVANATLFLLSAVPAVPAS